MSDLPFWRVKRLRDLSAAEWEALCDGCARCCLHKLEGPRGELHYTSVACRLLDLESCRCRCYAARGELVPGCLDLRRDLHGRWGWLPPTCAYRLLAEGQELPSWHPLVSGRCGSVHESGISVRSFAVSESQLAPGDGLESLLIDL
jgi:uncharacterized cysteine cluster protein YcgN (CxxCxxCC family)